MMSPQAKRKRSLNETDRPSKARRSSSTPIEPIERSEPLLIHRTTCNLKKSHYDHPRLADYHDAPRLFLGDSRASNLRGEDSMEDTEKYMEEHKDAGFIWIKNYNCNTYHDLIGDMFIPLRPPRHPMNENIARHFFVLEAHGAEAQPESEEIVIIAKDLQDKMEELIKIPTRSISTSSDTRETKTAMDRLYVHLRKHHTPTGEIDDQLECLLSVVETVFANDYQEADGAFSRGTVSKAHLAKLFRPDEIIVTSRKGHPRAYLLNGWPDWFGKVLSLPCVTWSFDGQFFQEVERIDLEWTFGDEEEVPITDLAVHPLRFDGNTEARLIKRGETFWQCRESRFISYAPSSPTIAVTTSHTRYMLDAKTYDHVHIGTIDKSSRVYLSKGENDRDHPPNEIFQLLLPPTIPGFGFHDKKWISVSVEDIREIQWNEEAFNHLVLKSTKKELIKALVAKHTAANDPNDVIEGKGNGLILLLHGGPGTGKTLTAESVAELTCKPLYRVTCGDIGTNAEEVERYLESVLYLGTIWKCVVLLDEADVFLEERTQQDLKRNALVSVFLRVLEYYSGILVLTSNRIGTFDEGFKSRVQLTLHYPTLDESSRRLIWLNFITRLRHTNPDAKVDQILENIDGLARFRLNGREIRNSIRTSMLLAEFRGELLQYSHLQDVIGISSEFEQYLQDTHGHSASENAKSLGIRRD